MDEIEIFWTFTAKRQRDLIFKYWNKRNGNLNYSRKLNLEFRTRVNLLKQNPELGKSIDFHNTRILIPRHYSIIYQPVLPKIFITGIWDNRKDPAKLLKFLKEK